ncbi:MAG: hypothetical protein WBG36_13745 [Ornithinimicrobium sp.]
MTVSKSRQITATLLLVQVGFQTCLAAGAPWGRASYGGQHDGVLPRGYRWVSAGAVFGYTAAAISLTRSAGSDRHRRAVLTGVATTMTVGALANGASRSSLERALWTPYCVLTAVCAWKARAAS